MSGPEIMLKPIGTVECDRKEAVDDFWGGTRSTIYLDPKQFTPDCTLGLDDFSHIEVVYQFHKVAPSDVVLTAGHPRERNDWPRVGIFAQRKKNRPNRMGVSVCRLLKVNGLKLTVEALDAIDGTPVIDIKPYMKEFAPMGPTKQPEWSSELMRNYFLVGSK
jgi:tRNA-Thr(GGU) m(6)t(6)A37 methyltransferase TsaA